MNSLSYSLTILPPGGTLVEPVTLSQAKLHLRVDGTDEDTLINSLISAARSAIEGQIGRLLVTRTAELGLVGFPFYGDSSQFYAQYGRYAVGPFTPYPPIPIPLPPLQSVVSIKYTKIDGTTVTVDPSIYTFDASGQPGLIFPQYQKTWPTDLFFSGGYPVRIQFTAGMTEIPQDLISAVLLMIGHLYMNREASTVGRMDVGSELPLGVQYLIQPHRYYEFQ